MPSRPIGSSAPQFSETGSRPRGQLGLPVSQMPEKSGLPSGVCGVGADKLGLPSGVVGTPAVGYFIHCAKAIAVQLKALANTIPRVSSEPRIDAYSAPVMLLIIA